jgi:hypothetical protein
VTQPLRCGWCGGELPAAGKLGRPRRYCGQPCRQRAYEHRHITSRAGLDDDAVVVSARELQDLQDRLFALRCAVEDVQTALAEDATRPELAATVRNLTDSVGTLDRIWVAARNDAPVSRTPR